MIKAVKHKTLIGIALIVTVLINLPRVLELYNIVEGLGRTFNDVSVRDISVRALFLFFFSWVILEFNSNWRLRYHHLNSYIKSIITVATNVLIFFATVALLRFAYPILTNTSLSSGDEGLLYFVYFVVIIILVFVARILRLQIVHQNDVVENELLIQKSLQNELSALKNQINPHFLFNSLNSLSSLVRENKTASTFVDKLSFMYRYILQSGQVDLIPLKDELKFLESYIYLIKTRYRQKFNIQIDIEEQLLQEEIPVLVLQLLVENAVKHNEISSKNPLLVKVYSNGHYLYVENKIKPRSTFVDSTGNGLENISKRYQLLKKKNITIENKNELFRVKLPLN